MANTSSSQKEQNVKDSTAVQSSVSLTCSCSFPSSWTLQETRGFQSKYFHLTMVAHLVPSWPGHVAVWTARRHRKGNMPYMMPVGSEATQVPSSPLRSLFAPFGYRLVGWEPSDLSFWVAQCFIWGSVLFVVNGVYAFQPVNDVSNQVDILGYSGLAGGALFLAGSILALFEIANTDENVKLSPHLVNGPALQMTSRSTKDHSKVASAPSPSPLTDLEGQPFGETRGGGGECADSSHQGAPKSRKFKFWVYQPRNLSWWIVILQLIGAVFFGVPACLTGVPNVLPTEDNENYAIWDALFWAPLIVGSIFFLLNGLFVMVEAQHSLFSIKLNDIAWHVGFWNLIGSAGFLFSGIFGCWASPSGNYQHWGTAFNTLWGSVFSLISSCLLLPEMLNKQTTIAFNIHAKWLKEDKLYYHERIETH